MEKILVAMSGGVDSAAACAVLRKDGFETGGATMLLRDGGEPEAEDARRSAETLGLPFCLFDLREEFRRNVIAPFAESYRAGETPNPCVFCNRTMKFGLFLDRAVSLGYDKIATGHYARVEYDAGSGRYLLKTALDSAKDQTYMLSVLDQKQLSRTVLPLGGMTKQQARELAAEAGLAVASKHDSQDICFVPDGNYMAYLTAHGFAPQKGRFIGLNGEDYGPHRGMEAYTVGQRRGLEVALGARTYVLEKRGADVVLGPPERLFSSRVLLREPNWIPFETLTAPVRCTAKLRYTAKPAACVAEPAENGILLLFDEPQRAPTPGQTAVLYDGETVLGSGCITRETQ